MDNLVNCQVYTNLINACALLALEKIYLVDVGYACRPGFLPPYRETRYHLKEYGGRNYPTNPRELFNLRHSSLRVTVERAFGALKNRFRIIDNKHFHPFRTQVKLVLACCILHNWILEHGVDEVIPSESSCRWSSCAACCCWWCPVCCYCLFPSCCAASCYCC
jgi:hypothetical protein